MPPHPPVVLSGLLLSRPPFLPDPFAAAAEIELQYKPHNPTAHSDKPPHAGKPPAAASAAAAHPAKHLPQHSGGSGSAPKAAGTVAANGVSPKAAVFKPAAAVHVQATEAEGEPGAGNDGAAAAAAASS